MAEKCRQKEKKIKMFKYLVLTLVGFAVGAGAYVTVTNVNKAVQVVQKMNVDKTEQLDQVAENTEPTEEASKIVDLNDQLFVLLYGPIGVNGIEVARAIKKAAREGKPVWLLIDSPGGSVISGAQIVSAIESAGVEVNTVCLTLCASMAAIIHQYGTNRYMVDRSILMFHEASGGTSGTVPQMLSQLTTMNHYIEKMIAQIAHRAGLSFKEFDSKLASELWLDSEDSLKQHFSDGTLNVYFEEEKAVNPPEKGLFPLFGTAPTKLKIEM